MERTALLLLSALLTRLAFAIELTSHAPPLCRSQLDIDLFMRFDTRAVEL